MNHDDIHVEKSGWVEGMGSGRKAFYLESGEGLQRP